MLTFSSGPSTNSAKARDGRPPESSSPRRPNTKKNSVLSVQSSCDLQHCHGHGSCITEDKVTRCQCSAGYKGEFCQETETGQSHAGAILGVLCLVIILMGAAFIFVRRYWPWRVFSFTSCQWFPHFATWEDKLNIIGSHCSVWREFLREFGQNNHFKLLCAA